VLDRFSWEGTVGVAQAMYSGFAKLSRTLFNLYKIFDNYFSQAYAMSLENDFSLPFKAGENEGDRSIL
jgi:hypothetical protein